MKAIVFLETQKSGSSREAIQAAENMGYMTVLLTGRQKWIEQRGEFPDVHWMELADLRRITELRWQLQSLQRMGLRIEAIVSFVDSYVAMAARLAELYCPHHNVSLHAVLAMENKVLSRRLLENSPYSPSFQVVDPQDGEKLQQLASISSLPLMVKHPASTGSKDVLYADSPEKLLYSVQSLAGEGTKLLIEQYLDGPQYLAEILVIGGEVQIAAVVEQQVQQGERFIITGYRVLSPQEASLLHGLEQAVYSIAGLFGIEWGACHLELRRASDGWKVIEANPRISGGAMNQMLQCAFGFNYCEQILRVILREQPQLQPDSFRHTFTQYVTMEQEGTLVKVTGRKRAASLPGVYKVYVKPRRGARLVKPTSMGHRFAYVIGFGSSAQAAIRRAKQAAACISFHLDGGNSQQGGMIR